MKYFDFKNPIVKIATILLILLLIYFSTTFSYALITDTLINAMLKFFATITYGLLWISIFFHKIASFFLFHALDKTVFEFRTVFEDNSFSIIWKALRDMVNVLIALLFIYSAAVASLQTFNFGEGGILIKNRSSLVKKLIFLFLAASLVNFSGFFALFLIDVSNILISLFSEYVLLLERISQEYTIFQETFTGNNVNGAGEGDEGIYLKRQIIFNLLLMPVVLFMAAATFLITIKIIIRFVYAVILIVTSPIAVVGYFLGVGFGEGGGKNPSGIVDRLVNLKNIWFEKMWDVIVNPIILLAGVGLITAPYYNILTTIEVVNEAGKINWTNIIELIIFSIAYIIALLKIISGVNGLTRSVKGTLFEKGLLAGLVGPKVRGGISNIIRRRSPFSKRDEVLKPNNPIAFQQDYKEFDKSAASSDAPPRDIETPTVNKSNNSLGGGGDSREEFNDGVVVAENRSEQGDIETPTINKPANNLGDGVGASLKNLNDGVIDVENSSERGDIETPTINKSTNNLDDEVGAGNSSAQRDKETPTTNKPTNNLEDAGVRSSVEKPDDVSDAGDPSEQEVNVSTTTPNDIPTKTQEEIKVPEDKASMENIKKEEQNPQTTNTGNRRRSNNRDINKNKGEELEGNILAVNVNENTGGGTVESKWEEQKESFEKLQKLINVLSRSGELGVMRESGIQPDIQNLSKLFTEARIIINNEGPEREKEDSKSRKILDDIGKVITDLNVRTKRKNTVEKGLGKAVDGIKNAAGISKTILNNVPGSESIKSAAKRDKSKLEEALGISSPQPKPNELTDEQKQALKDSKNFAKQVRMDLKNINNDLKELGNQIGQLETSEKDLIKKLETTEAQNKKNEINEQIRKLKEMKEVRKKKEAENLIKKQEKEESIKNLE